MNNESNTTATATAPAPAPVSSTAPAPAAAVNPPQVQPAAPGSQPGKLRKIFGRKGAAKS